MTPSSIFTHPFGSKASLTEEVLIVAISIVAIWHYVHVVKYVIASLRKDNQ